jgi:hypothetical protein
MALLLSFAARYLAYHQVRVSPGLRIRFDPKGPRAGLWLSGNLVTTSVANWPFSDRYRLIEPQTDT